jgi:LacI family transcriptional regulator
VNQRSAAAPTIFEVAEKAGVSIKTVSRVMNNEANVRPETREQVLRVVAELKYRPKLSARSLPGGRSFLIGLLYYDPSAEFIAGVQRGATMRCRERGYHVVVESFSGDQQGLVSQLDQMLAALRPDGMILTPPICDNPAVIAALKSAGTPCVLISPGRAGRKLPHVRMDDEHAAAEVAEHLLGLGHRRIGLVEGPPDQAAASWRRKGFERALRAHGVALEERWVARGAFTFDSGLQAAEQLLRQRTPPTAVFASNDDMALAVLATAQRMGLQVPHDLSIVGFDDSPAAGLVWPALTTVRQPVFEMACAAVDMLVARPAAGEGGTSPASCVLPHELVLRASTGHAPGTTNATGSAAASAPAGGAAANGAAGRRRVTSR